MVHVADGRWLGAAGERAVLVALDDGGAQAGRDGAGGAAEVQGLAGGAEWGAEQGAAQLGGQPAGPGQQVEAPAQDGGLQPPPGGLQAAGYPAVMLIGGGGLAGARAGAVAGAGERDGAGARARGRRLVRPAAWSSRGPSGVGRPGGPVRVVFRPAVRVASGSSAGAGLAWSSRRRLSSGVACGRGRGW